MDMAGQAVAVIVHRGGWLGTLRNVVGAGMIVLLIVTMRMARAAGVAMVMLGATAVVMGVAAMVGMRRRSDLLRRSRLGPGVPEDIDAALHGDRGHD